MTTARVRRGAVPLLWLAACGSSGLPTDPDPFGGPQPVAIQGHGGDAMGPALSPDGQLLLFNDSNAPGADTDLHWTALDAAQPDGLHFTYGGPVAAANGNALDAVASLDVHANRYFISADGLELYFTRLTGTGTTTAVYPSRRPNTASPWGAPAPIEALAGGVVEAATPSADGKALHDHRLVGTTFRIERVRRR